MEKRSWQLRIDTPSLLTSPDKQLMVALENSCCFFFGLFVVDVVVLFCSVVFFNPSRVKEG